MGIQLMQITRKHEKQTHAISNQLREYHHAKKYTTYKCSKMNL